MRVPLSLWFLLVLPVQAETFTAKCVGVTDGDTITVLRGTQQVRVRLDGIDTPETRQDFSDKAKRFTSALVFEKVVQIKVTDTDQYGRSVARVVSGGVDVSVALVTAGLAWHYKQFSDDPILALSEQSARKAKIGLWSQAESIAPWAFRKGKRLSKVIPSRKPAVLHGNRRSKVFHSSNCRYYNCKNCTAVFRFRRDAIRAGYRPDSYCSP